MSEYINVSLFIRPIARSIDDNWSCNEKASFLERNVFSRGANLCLVPLSFFTSLIDTAIGVGSLIFDTISAGTNKKLHLFTFNHLSSSNKILVRPYQYFLGAVNPRATFSKDLSSYPFAIRYLAGGDYKNPLVSCEGDGLITSVAKGILQDLGRVCYNSENIIVSQIASRLTYIALGATCVVTRSVDGLIALPAVSSSLIAGGTSETLNNIAYRSLQAPGIINDLAYVILKTINPWTGMY